MIGALALVAIVAVVALTVLLLVWTDRRRTVRRQALHKTSLALQEARGTLTSIENELDLAEQAGMEPDIALIRSYLRDHVARTYPEETRS